MRRRTSARVSWAIAAIALLSAASAQGFSTGIATTSFPVPAQGCNFCHSGGSVPTVTLECVDCGGAPPVVDPLSVHEFKLTVVEVGLQTHAGLNVSSVDGILATGGGFSAGTQTLVGTGSRQEITHTAPKPAAGGVTEFSFLWTAPAAPGTSTLVGWGNAVNFLGSTAGDRANTVSLNVAVGVPEPTATDTPTATPTATPAPSLCPAMMSGCAGGFPLGRLSIKASAGREKLVAKLLKGGPLSQTDMGNPLSPAEGGTGTAYALCIYDDGGALAGEVSVDRADAMCGTKPCWKAIGNAPNDPNGPGSGYKYKDAALTADGVAKLLYKGGPIGKAKAIVVGKGAGLPSGITAALQTTTQVTLQLHSSDGICLTTVLNDIKAQDATLFKAK